ncbi:MAG: insulinase family protein, partial [Pseudomonadota bacterium]
GSLLSLLKQTGLAEALSAGGGDQGDGSSAFYITIQLSEKGLQQRERVRALVFQTIRLIEQQGIAEWRYQESSRLAQTAFAYRDQSSPINLVKALADNIHSYAPKDIISGDYLMENYKPELIKRFLALMTPDKVFVATLDPNANTDKISAYYQAPYRTQSISLALVDLDKQWIAQLALPLPNPFVPDNMALFKHQPALQEIAPIDSVDGVTLWAKQDTRFATPKAKVTLRIMSPRVSGSLKGYALNALYAALLQDQLNEYNYSALLAGSGMGMRPNHHGLDITITGYQDKLNKLMQVLLTQMNSDVFKRQRFEQIKSDLIRNWRNSNKRTPYQQLYSRIVFNLYQSYWSDDDKINAMATVTLEELTTFAKTWRKGAQIKGLMYGNIDRAWIAAWRPLIEQLPLAKATSLIPPVRITKLKNKAPQYDVRPVDHNDQAVALYIQGASDTIEDRALMVLMRQIMQSPFYTSLRTEQQLGYIVFMGSLRLRQVPGSVFVVQSPSSNVDDIKRAITTFIGEFSQRLPTDISLYQQAVMTQLLEKPSGLSASANEYWVNILHNNDQFNYRQQLAEAVNALSVDQLKSYYTNVIANPAHYLWQLSSHPQQLQSVQVYQRGEDYYQYFP